MSKNILSVLFFLIIQVAYSQNPFIEVTIENADEPKKKSYFLTVKVTEDETLRPIHGVTIYINGVFLGNKTDQLGQSFLRLDSGQNRLVFRKFGRQNAFYQLNLQGSGRLDVSLGSITFELESFTLRSENRDEINRKPTIGISQMNIEEIKLVPTVMGEPDVFNVLQAMPGVTSVGEGAAGLNIRGGLADQNLILLNDAVVLNNNHALGFLSAYNGDVLQNFTLYKGALPSNYGGRTASAINVEMRNGNKESWKGSVTLGTALSKFMVEGPIKKEKTGLILAVRNSNINWMLNQLENRDLQNTNIRFHDIYAGINHIISPKNNLELNVLRTGDSFTFSNQFGYEWQNLLLSLTSRNLITDNLSVVGMVAYGNFANSFFEPEGIDPVVIQNGLSHLQGKVSGLWTFEKSEVQVGMEGLLYNMAPETEGPFTASSTIIPRKINKQRGLETAPFVSVEWNPNASFSLIAGARYSFYSQLGPDTLFLYAPESPMTVENQIGAEAFANGKIVSYQGFEPRASLRYSLNETQSLKAGFSVLNQYLQTISNATGPTPIDLWQLSTTYLLPQRSENYSIGYFSKLFKNSWDFSVEGFFRRTDNQLEYRDFADLFLNSHLETETVQGEGKAHGVELMLQKNTGRVTGWVAYTLSRSRFRTTSPFSEVQVNRGDWYPTNFDRPHIVSMVTNVNLGLKRSFNVNVNFSSGRPITGLNSNYNINGVFVPNFGDRNQFRIPNYFRIDLSYLTNGPIRAFDDHINFSIYNLLARRNAFSVFFQRDGNVPRLVPFQLSILGTVLPTISYTVNF